MTVWAEIAKFLAGVFAWNAFVHASLLAAKLEPKVLGILWTKKLNKSDLVFSLVLTILLIYIGWFSGWQI